MLLFDNFWTGVIDGVAIGVIPLLGLTSVSDSETIVRFLTIIALYSGSNS